MNNLSKEEIMSGKIAAANQLHVFMRKTVPALIEHFKNNPPKITTDGYLYKKQREAVDKILRDMEVPANLRKYISVDGYSGKYISLKADITYRVGEYSVDYIHRSAVVWDDTTASEFNEEYYPFYDEQEVADAMKEIARASLEIKELEDKISSLKNRIPR